MLALLACLQPGATQRDHHALAGRCTERIAAEERKMSWQWLRIQGAGDVFNETRVGRRSGWLDREAALCQIRPCLLDSGIRNGDDHAPCLADGGQDLPTTRRRGNGDALSFSAGIHNRRGLGLAACKRRRQRRAARRLHGEDARQALDQPGAPQVLEAVVRPQQQRTIAHRQDQHIRRAAKLLPDLEGVGLGPLEKEGLINVAGVKDLLALNRRDGRRRRILPAARDCVDGCAVRRDLPQLLGRGAGRNIDIAGNTGARRVGRNRSPGVAAAVGDDARDPQLPRFGDQHRRAAILERERRHLILHLEENARRFRSQSNQRREALAHRDRLPASIFRREGQRLAVAPQGWWALLNAAEREARSKLWEVQQPAAGAAPDQADWFVFSPACAASQVESHLALPLAAYHPSWWM